MSWADMAWYCSLDLCWIYSLEAGGTSGNACDGNAVLALAYTSSVWYTHMCTVPTLTIPLCIFVFILIPRDGGLRM
jgi:hypothetical protein